MGWLVGRWLMGVSCGMLVSVFVRVGGGRVIFFYTAVLMLVFLLRYKPGRLWHTSKVPLQPIGGKLIAELSTNRVRRWCNLVLQASDTHFTTVFNNQQQGAQQ